jgi:EmrB/QacA subfamily drug resistance transporter
MTENTDIPAEPAAGPPGVVLGTDPQRWLGLTFIALCQLMIVLDITVVTIALPSAQTQLHIQPADKQWVLTAYTLAFGGLLLLGGKIADFVGRKRTLVIGLIGFAAASALGGASVSGGMLFSARALQGCFGALLAPSALSLLTTMFVDPKERAKAFGIYSGLAGGGSAIGLILGGVVTEYLGWRWTLYINVAIAVLAVVGSVMFVHDHAPRRRVEIDYLGIVLGCGGLLLVVYGFTEAAIAKHGWAASSTLGLLIGGVACVLAFVFWQRRAKAPLLPLRVVTDRNRAAAFLVIGLSSIGMFGVFLFLTYYLQVIKGYTPLAAGFAFLPLSVVLIGTSVGFSARMLPRLAPRLLLAPGMLLAACGMLWLTRLKVGGGYGTEVLPAEILLGLGFGLTFMPVFATATSGVDPRDSGITSATLNTAQQVGGSIGTALLNSIATTAAAGFIAAKLSAGAAVSKEAAALVQAQGVVHGYSVAAAWAAGVLLVSGIIGALMMNAGPAVGGGPGAGSDETADVTAVIV